MNSILLLCFCVYEAFLSGCNGHFVEQQSAGVRRGIYYSFVIWFSNMILFTNEDLHRSSLFLLTIMCFRVGCQEERCFPISVYKLNIKIQGILVPIWTSALKNKRYPAQLLACSSSLGFSLRTEITSTWQWRVTSMPCIWTAQFQCVFCLWSISLRTELLDSLPHLWNSKVWE